jgi:hypothetical protein
MSEDRALRAYGDESGINVGDRYTSVCVVSGEAGVLDCLRRKLDKTLREKNVDEVKFTKIRRYEGPMAQAAVKFIECTVNDFAAHNKVRVDTITMDNEYLGGDNYDYGHKPELERMYYCVLAHIVRRWRYRRWDFYADVNSRVDWQEIVEYLNMTSMQKKIKKPLLMELMSEENPEFEFSGVKELNSAGEPLIQLADLFAGMARFSYEDDGCARWADRWKPDEQMELIPYMARDKKSSDKVKECRYKLIAGVYNLCHRHRLYLSIKTDGHLRTRRHESPINFWAHRGGGY